jgi:hypothetical protein
MKKGTASVFRFQAMKRKQITAFGAMFLVPVNYSRLLPRSIYDDVFHM